MFLKETGEKSSYCIPISYFSFLHAIFFNFRKIKSLEHVLTLAKVRGNIAETIMFCLFDLELIQEDVYSVQSELALEVKSKTFEKLP